MPTYTYKREDGSVFDTMQGINEPALTVCPTTGQAVKRVITGGAGVVYKGTGWYVTDYKGNGSPSSKSSSNTEGNSDTSTSSTASTAEATPPKESSTSPSPATSE